MEELIITITGARNKKKADHEVQPKKELNGSRAMEYLKRLLKQDWSQSAGNVIVKSEFIVREK